MPDNGARAHDCALASAEDCTFLHWRRFPNRVTMHGVAMPVVAHGILEVAEHRRAPQRLTSDVGQLNAPTKFV